MWLYLDGSERGLRLKLSLLTDNYLILIDLNENRMFLKPMIKQNIDCLRQEKLKISTAMYITQELNYNTLRITWLCVFYRLKRDPVMWVNYCNIS